MSSDLHWRPADPPSRGSVGSAKFMLRELFGNPISVTLDSDNIPELRALIVGGADGDVKRDIEKVIKAIEKHGRIILEETWG